GKPERERWVVRQFLSHLPISFCEGEVYSLPQHSKVDVGFRHARFQVKEIVDDGTRRGDEIKAMWRRVQVASRLEEIVGPCSAYDIPPPIKGYELVRDRASQLAGKYKEYRLTLDLLFYVTRTRTSPIRAAEVNRGDLELLGWRSVSCLMGDN